MLTVRLIHAVICALFGYSAFLTFIVLKNYPSAVLGLISGITDSILFFLHYLERKGKLGEWYGQTDLRIICRYGITVATIGLLCLGYFTTIQILRKPPLLPVTGSSVISIVWSFVALRAGIVLMIYSIKYQHTNESILLTEEEPTNVDENKEEVNSATDVVENDKS